MQYKTYQYRATHYTGANVSIMIGPNLLTQAFGISWSKSQSKRPIYGYNSQYFDAVSDGVSLVQGELYINFVHSAYLSTVLQKYFAFLNISRDIYRNGNGSELIDYIAAHESISPLVNVIRDAIDPPLGLGSPEDLERRTFTQSRILDDVTSNNTIDGRVRPNLNQDEIPDRLDLNMSNSQRTRALDQALNTVFSSEEIQSDLISFFTGGINSGGSLLTNEDGLTSYEGSLFGGDRLQSIVERNQHIDNSSRSLMQLASPDQFGNANSPPRGIDIVVHFGPPFGKTDQNQIYNYSNRSSFVLRDVRFTGEAGEIMSNDSPILETYSFLARKKETLARTQETQYE